MTSRLTDRLAMVASATPHGVVLCDPAGRTEWVNEGFTRMCGYGLDELVGRKPGSLLQAPDTDPATVAFMSDRLRRQEGFRVEVLNRAKDGRLYWCDIDVRPTFDAAGLLEGFVALEAEITETKEWARRSKLQTAALRSAGRIAKVGGWEVDFERQLVTWSDELSDILGQPHRGPFRLGEDFSVFDENERALVIETIEQTAAKGQRFDFEVMARRPDGQALCARLMGEPEMRDGKPVAVRGALQDVTEQRQVFDQLAEAERFAQAALDCVGANICVIDGRGVILAVNKRWREFADANGMADPSYGVGLNYLAQCYGADETSVGEMRRGIEAVLDGRRAVFSQVYPCHSPDEHAWYELTATRFAGDGPVRAVLSHQAVTALKLSEEKLRETNLRLAEALKEAEAGSRAKSEFLANMSHELRTPMNGVIAMLDLMLPRLQGEERELAEVAHQSAHGMMAMVNGVLEYSRLESERVELRHEPFDPRLLLQALAGAMSVKANAVGAILSTAVDGDSPGPLLGDAEKLAEVLVQLVDNAIKFAGAGRVDIRARTDVAGEGLVDLELSVSDEGPGVPENARARVFERFNQADNSSTRRVGGAGLGLSIARRLAEAMGGQIGVEESESGGARFLLRVRLERAEV